MMRSSSIAAVAVVSFASVSLAAGPFLKEPYLLYGGTISAMSVQWQLEDTQQCLIEWGTDTTYSMGSAVTDEYTEDHLHIQTITGLIPSERYFYLVSCSGFEIAGSFHAAPEAGASDASFMVYGDTRTAYMCHDSIAALMVDRYTADPALQTILLHTGDLVYTGGLESSWQNEFFNDEQVSVRQLMREVPLIACLGNHELYSDTAMHLDTPLFGKYFPYPYAERRYWSLDYGPAHIVVADLYPEYYKPFDPGQLSPEELAWIESDLAATTKPWKFVILHEPGWSCGPAGECDPSTTSTRLTSSTIQEPGWFGGRHYNNEDVQNLLQPLLETHGVQILFAAHNHYYARGCINGVHHITTGGGGAPLAGPQTGYPNIITCEPCHHICCLEITGDLLSMSVIDIGGNVIDCVSIDLNTPVNYLLGSVTIGGGPGSVQEVLIEVDGSSCNPDSRGYYGMMLEPGVYSVSASLSGYTPQTFEGIEVFEGTETTLDIVMYPLSVEGGGLPVVMTLAMSPNPFSTTATVCFELPEAGPVSLDAFDLSGRLVETLAEGEMTAGGHSAVFDGSGLASGVYLVRLESGTEVSTARMVLVR